MTAVAASPLLAFGPPGWLAYAVIGIGGTLLVGGAVYQASRSADDSFPRAVPRAVPCQNCEPEQHRGRVQAQGGGLERSLPWGQPTPPTVAQGVALLTALYGSLSRSEQRARETALAQAIRWVRGRPPGGVFALQKKSFPQPPLPGGIRIDIEILAGSAFFS